MTERRDCGGTCRALAEQGHKQSDAERATELAGIVTSEHGKVAADALGVSSLASCPPQYKRARPDTWPGASMRPIQPQRKGETPIATAR